MNICRSKEHHNSALIVGNCPPAGRFALNIRQPGRQVKVAMVNFMVKRKHLSFFTRKDLLFHQVFKAVEEQALFILINAVVYKNKTASFAVLCHILTFCIGEFDRAVRADKNKRVFFDIRYFLESYNRYLFVNFYSCVFLQKSQHVFHAFIFGCYKLDLVAHRRFVNDNISNRKSKLLLSQAKPGKHEHR